MQKSLELIKRGTVEIIEERELMQKLESRKPLIVKVGFDPTAPDIHLGHTVLLRKMRHFQDIGHKVVFLIGDATALVGDPSGQSQARKVLTQEEVEKNAITYEKQVGKVLNIKDPSIFERRHNSQWFCRKAGRKTTPFDFEKFIELAQKYTVARLLERDDFQKRLKENKPISFLELFYPLMQGYDSVYLKADVEIGGTDQKFNMLVGRDLQRAYNQQPQIVITMPLLEGTDGVQKMSKSLGNYIGINEPPKEIFGKIMSISDELMWRYYELLTDIPMEEIAEMKKNVFVDKLNPRDAKVRLAKEIITVYYGSKEAEKQAGEFENIFKKKELPEDILCYQLDFGKLKDGKIWICALLTQAGLSLSNSDARRLIRQGAVSIDNEKISDENLQIIPKDSMVIQSGKRKFVRIKF